MLGKVKWHNSVKGYGFIESPDLDKDIFFHISRVAPGYVPKENDAVEFDIGEGKKGSEALDVRKIG